MKVGINVMDSFDGPHAPPRLVDAVNLPACRSAFAPVPSPGSIISFWAVASPSLTPAASVTACRNPAPRVICCSPESGSVCLEREAWLVGWLDESIDQSRSIESALDPRFHICRQAKHYSMRGRSRSRRRRGEANSCSCWRAVAWAETDRLI